MSRYSLPPRKQHIDILPPYVNHFGEYESHPSSLLTEVDHHLNFDEKANADFKPLDYKIVAASQNYPNGKIWSLMSWNRSTCWEGGYGKNWIILEVEDRSLLTYIKIWNAASSTIDVLISLNGTKKQDFISIKHHSRLPHGKIYEIPIGHLPCRYIRLELTGAQNSTCLHAIELMGLQLENLHQCMDERTVSAIYFTTKEFLYGPSLKASLRRSIDC